ncbi:MAG: glycerate kinase [Alphaproteobacteria bacterium]|nr:glycerate kinase [Alphaproteobacteria bacterium]
MDAPRHFLRALFRAAVDAADPARAIPRFLPPRPEGRLIVVGAGKAAASMARAVEGHINGPVEGLAVTRYGHGAPCQKIEIIEAAHPVPDRAGLFAARRILELCSNLSERDLVLCLMSGGASALLTLPAEGVQLEDMRTLTQALLKSGATIHEINCVRKHLSAIQGGRLAAAAHPARVVTLAISDVPGDDPAVIGSGPTVPDPTTLAEARAILAKYRIEPPPSCRDRLAQPAAETPKPGDMRLTRAEYRMIASPKASLDAAADVARKQNVQVLSLGDAVEGEAREVGARHAHFAREVRAGLAQVKPLCVVLSGGETTVTVRGQGRGGRNAEYLLGLTVALDSMPGVFALAGDTDGIDGMENNAGALTAPDSLERARAAGLDPAAMLDNNDGYTFFEALGDLVVTGPTLTNVNDFRALLILP